MGERLVLEARTLAVLLRAGGRGAGGRSANSSSSFRQRNDLAKGSSPMDESLQVVHESSVGESVVVVEPLSFEVFFDREARTLFRRLCAVTGNSAEAEEVMQDTFLALFERWERVGRMDDPTGYLYRTAMNQFRKRTRRAALALRRTFALAPEPMPFSEIDEQLDVVAALRELTPRQRAALVLTEVLGYTSEEAGAALGISAGTVRGLASRGRSTIRLQMGVPE